MASYRVPTYLEILENSWNFWYDKSIYAGFDTVTTASRTSNLCYKGMSGERQ